MSDLVEEIGRAAGQQTADLISARNNNDFRFEIIKKPKVGDKSLPENFFESHVFETRRRPVNPAATENQSDTPSTGGRSILERLGARIGESVIVAGNQKPDPVPEGVIEPPPTKGLGDPSAVDLINQDLQLAQAEAAIPAGAGAGTATGSGGLAKILAAFGSFLSIPFTTAMLFFYRPESVADSTLEGLPPELQAQLQARLELELQEGGELGSGLVITRSAEGLLEVTSSQTGQPVIGANGQVLDQQALTALVQGFYSDIEYGDPVPGLTLPSNIITFGPFSGVESAEFNQVRQHNASAGVGDRMVILQATSPAGEQYRAIVRGGIPELMANLLQFELQGLLPEGMTALETFVRSGIDLAAERGAIRDFMAERSLLRAPLTLFGRRAEPFSDAASALAGAQQHNAATGSLDALRLALTVRVDPQGSLLDSFFPDEAHDYIGHVNFTGSMEELLVFLQTMHDQGRLLPGQGIADALQASGLLAAIERLGSAMPIVLGEGSGPMPSVDGLTPEEQQRLGLPGTKPTDAEPVELPQIEGFPDQPDEALDGSTPEPAVPQEGIPGDETIHSGGNESEDLEYPHTSFPAGGEEVPITSIHDIPDAHLGVRLDQLTEPLRGNPPLEDGERLALGTVILGGKPDTPDGQRFFEVAATKLGINPHDVDGARRELLARIGAGSSDEVRRLMLGGGAADLLNRYPEITTALLRNVQTFQSLSTHADALQIFEYLLSEIDSLGPMGITLPEPVNVVDIVLPPELYAISARAREAAPLSSIEVRQPGFDPNLIGNADETSFFVNQLYADAAAAMPVLRDTLLNIAGPLGVEVVVRESPKSRARVFEKIEKYGGDAARVTDLTAGRVIADDLNQVYEVLESLLMAENVRVLSVYDRIVRPQPSGYRDITMQVEIALPDGRTHVGEIQVQLRELYDFAANAEHALYEVIRSISKAGEGASLAAQALVQQMRNYSRTEYNDLIEAELDYIRNEPNE
jgi:hypothetical protein